ncbi:hypothetical protein GOBAR_AA08990 [Gossypium barbadense]|uniref:Rx N-terminal domain-containing protein n=1 Tax=Gossypium barbadense TaxID=3634 RepID=A0A2P5Y7U2_GOSBA|nr:hypothetical protein GOBAR_AA08990 [Gossypium barbadense]
MSVFGEDALSAFLELLSAKLLDSVLNFVADHRQVHQQLQLWQSILPEIKVVLNHAEEKQIKDEGVKNWLDDLQDFAYDVDDILDNFAYQELRLKHQKTRAQASTSKVQELIPTCCTGGYFSPISFMFNAKMISKITAITDRLNSLNTRRSSLGLSEIMSQGATSKGKKPRLQPTSLMDGAVEYTILRSLDANSRDENDLNLLQVKLKEKLSGKRFLLVLDDIWNESYSDWTILRAPFAAGTKIIITTRLEKVSSNVDPVKAFYLDKLSHHDCLSIFAQHALKARSFAGHLQFKEIGENIVRRFNGLPLAAKAIGSLLRTVQDHSEWENEKYVADWRVKSNKSFRIVLVTQLMLAMIGEGDGLLIRELKNLSSLRGNFCLSGLENVNGQDAREAKLNEKLGIDGLVLQWGADLANSTRKKGVEERVLDFLRPLKKLEQLIIENYGGVKFSSWIADSSFENLSSLKLRNCKNCKSLPSVGRLPLLKDLSIIGFDQVQKIGVEFFGENTLNPFASLEILSFESLPNWKEWDACEGNEKVLKLPSLRELSIKTCPQLLGRLPTHLLSLQKLEIHGCTSLVVSISSFPSLCELSIEGCAELVDDCSSPAKEVSSLQTLSLSNISKFNIPADRTMLRFGN